MQNREWTRSRFWLCHFLHNRHERPPIEWDQPVEVPTPWRGPLLRWLHEIAADGSGRERWLIGQAVRYRGRDPAYVQCLRLFIKEQQAFRGMAERLLERFHSRRKSESPFGRCLRTLPWARRILGLRFELSVLLLNQIIQAALDRLIRDAAADAVLRGVCAQAWRDRHAHAAFHAERLTLEFADFNFIRRNLRRLRLRVQFGVMLTAAVLRHRRLIRAAGSTETHFIRQGWASFTSLLEQMVPYHRAALLAALLRQREHPYDKPARLS